MGCYTDSSHDELQPLSNDRDCSQANFILKGRVQDTHDPSEAYLPSYLVVGASLPKVNSC
jgi:hypothetical protein